MRLPTPEEGVTRVPQCGDEDYERCPECQASRYERHLTACPEVGQHKHEYVGDGTRPVFRFCGDVPSAWNDPLPPALFNQKVWPMGSGSG